ncbi:hypothetical protein [Pseudoclavibacter sp. JSM 162008]|uniref:hypothetical protein n=1 Tax=Pseudoclavibacter sp. JSM 162008 TaxID=3229855 RepID=UPI0035258E03
MRERRTESSTGPHLKWAAILQLVQGVLMEGIPFLGLIVLLAVDADASVMERGFSFIVPFFDEHLYLMMAMSGVFAALRIVGAIGLLRNRMWGFALTLLNCVITLTLMMFMLPAGIADGLLAGSALVLLLMARYGTSPIETRSR